MDDATPNWSSERALKAVLDAFEREMSKHDGTFAERERKALELANEVVRRWTQSTLNEMSARYGDELLVNGQRYRRHATGTRRYHSLCGGIEVQRDSYRLVGVHNGPTVIPLDIEAGIMENATPALAFSVVQAFAAMPLRQFEDEMRAAHRSLPSRSTLERVAKRIGTTIHEEMPVIEPVVRAKESVPKRAHSISVGLDRTTVPMAEVVDGRPRRRERPYLRKPPATITVAYRMAYVGTVAIHDERGETIASTRVTATPEQGSAELMERLAAELQHTMAQRPRLPVIVVQDGAPELWFLVEEWLDNLGIVPTMSLIDRYHVDERIAGTCEAITATADAAENLRRKWRMSLDQSDTAINRICRRLDELLYEENEMGFLSGPTKPAVLQGEAARIVEGHATYFTRNRDKIRYATAIRRGFPIGSGVTEGACKSVIAMRFKRSGQRWFENGLSPCLQMRTLHLNGRLRASFDFLVEDRRKSLQSH